MISLAALSGPFPKAGVVVVAALVGTALVHPGARPRAAAMLCALLLAPVLLLAAIWNSPQLGIIHRHPLEAAVVAIVGLAVVATLAIAIARRPSLLAPLVAFAFPFRVPISSAGTTSNLLVPLYLVVGAGVLAYVVSVLRGGGFGQVPPGDRARVVRTEDGRGAATEDGRGAATEDGRGAATEDGRGAATEDGRGAATEDGRAGPEPPPGWIDRLLAVVVVLYAIQALYSPGFEKALQQTVFFYVPFALMFCLLRRLRLSQRLLIRCLGLVVGLALVFAVIGFVEYATKTLLLNPKLIAQNNVHTYFVINSVFLDPDIFGRFLALVMITVAAVLLYARSQREQLYSVGVLAVLWAGLVLTLSRSSLGALLVGLGVLGALRWRARPILLSAAAVVVIGGIAFAVSPNTFGVEQGANGVSAGRTSLIGGGVHLFRERPVWGYGSASFETEYLCRIKHLCGAQPEDTQVLSASHTIPVTIAAEQGLIGEIPYIALVIVAAMVLLTGARRSPPRAAVAAAFIALVFHTMAYADFLEDPATWILLGIGVALSYAATNRIGRVSGRADELAAVA